MNIIVCIDDHNGMMFNKRRVSQDKLVREDILNNLHGKKLMMNSYSFHMFKEEDTSLIEVIDNLPVFTDCFQFIEDIDISLKEKEIDLLIIYYWNRKYPSDFSFKIDMNKQEWKLISEKEFVGNSHDKITKRVFEKVGG